MPTAPLSPTRVQRRARGGSVRIRIAATATRLAHAEWQEHADCEQRGTDERSDELIGDDERGDESSVGTHQTWRRYELYGRLAVSYAVSPTPMRNAVTYSIGSAAVSVASAMMSSVSAMVRPTLTALINRRRSIRSATAPAGKPSSSHGRYCTTATPATRRGSCVRMTASSGNAASLMPSPRFDSVTDVHSRQNAPGNGADIVAAIGAD